MKKTRTLLIAALAGLAAVGTHSRAHAGGSVTIDAAKDNTLYQSVAGNVSNGQGPHLYAGANGGGQIRRALLAFDIASSIPTGSTITSVTLQIHISNTSGAGGGPVDYTLQRMLADWGEGKSNAGIPGGSGAIADSGDATWTHAFFGVTPWTTEGGDFDALVSASTTIDNVGFYSFSSTQMIADVQSWLDSGDSFGWIMRGNELDNFVAKRIDSRENSDPALRPMLFVEYSGAVPAPGALALLSIAAVSRRRRRRVH